MEGQKQEVRPIAEPKQAHRAWSLYLLTVAGIPIYLHFTFLLMLGVIAWFQFATHQMFLGGVLFVIAIFASVCLHELGHALVARRYGIRTDDIVLYPIGGVARLRSMGEGFQEFWIAIAGPMVNVVIVSLIAGGLILSGQWPEIRQQLDQQMARPETASIWIQNRFWFNLMAINLFLIIFNLIPAFPMDGGRVLRAVLARWLPRERATAIAAKIGQGLAIVFMLVGFFNNPFLMFIGFFVFVAAGQESAATRSAALMAGKRVRDAMITHFEVLSHGDSLAKAADLLLATTQQDFPVLNGGEVLGVLSRKALVQGLAMRGRDHYVAEVMDRQFPRLRPDDDLQRVYEVMRDGQGLPVMVFDGDRLAGFINNENLMEYLLIASARPAVEGRV